MLFFRPPLFATLLLAALPYGPVLGQITNVQIHAEADAFLREAAPNDNYGRAGSLAVAGTSALNGFDEPGGRTESLVRFRISEVISSLDAVYGNHEWFIARAEIQAYEMATPNNAIFSRGTGAFAIHWLSAGDEWDEGTGSPNAPMTDGVAFKDLPGLLSQSSDLPLGSFTNKGADGTMIFNLDLPSAFTDDLRSGDPVTIRFLPLDDLIGFTFLSRSDRRPELQMTLNLKIADGPAPRISSISRIDSTTVSITFLTKPEWITELQSWDEGWKSIFTAPADPVGRKITVSQSAANPHQIYRLAAYPPEF